ncbi:MAG TPA: hypothetical protein VFQ65_02830 [Kofleriaceae bacterium]|nr:hypothetical protein [Kofleriaceae bacterium]
MVTNRLAILAAVFLMFGGAAYAQPSKIRIGIYAPSVEFGTAQQRLAYVQGLAKAIEQSTGIKTEAQSYGSIAALKADSDFAIIDGPCYAVNLSWKLLANANIGGTTRTWALFSSAGDSMTSLRGKKLAFVATGCNDAGFVDNAMLESEVDPQFFGARVGEKDLTGAISDVQSYKTAQAVFAPVSAVKGLTKLFETGSVPNPAFVQIDTKLPQATVDKVAAAVTGFGGAGAINGWTKPDRGPFTALAGRLGRVTKQGVLANPDPVRIDGRDVLIDPSTLRDTSFVAVRHHYVRPPGARME